MTFHFIHLKTCPIDEQLKLEEDLLRNSSDNFCVINEGTSPAIVLGISGKVEELVNEGAATKQNIPLIRRFSGGGTVIVDEETLFVTFICQKDLHPFPAYPEPIMRWTEEIYKEVFDHPQFALKENDYIIGDRKCGGNAQYIKKNRWLHHTSFLWNFQEERMNTLLHPKKTPPYRQGRSHLDFLCTLHTLFPSREAFKERLLQALSSRFTIQSSR
ncbi:MAG: hypothetical protein RLZZ453_580 [Chlamydiota bacterium]|jgi:lipoate-protein ligase A